MSEGSGWVNIRKNKVDTRLVLCHYLVAAYFLLTKRTLFGCRLLRLVSHVVQQNSTSNAQASLTQQLTFFRQYVHPPSHKMVIYVASGDLFMLTLLCMDF